MASVRPQICRQLPRQGVPPELEGWEQLAAELRWGAAAGAVPHHRMWWWELRPHVSYGTLELRVPDAQTTVAEAAGVIAFAQALVAQLADQYDAGAPLLSAPTWRIEENRWSALRYGLDGTLADVVSGEPVPTRERLAYLLDIVETPARRLGSLPLLDFTRALIARNGAARQREHAAAHGIAALPQWLADRFMEPLPFREPEQSTWPAETARAIG
jgi:carboxylate-amine ligase